MEGVHGSPRVLWDVQGGECGDTLLQSHDLENSGPKSLAKIVPSVPPFLLIAGEGVRIRELGVQAGGEMSLTPSY